MECFSKEIDLGLQPGQGKYCPGFILPFMKSIFTLQNVLAAAFGLWFSASASAQIHLQESFNSNSIPSGWTVADQGAQVCQWMIHAPIIGGADPTPMLGTNFLYVNSDSAGFGTVAYETVTSPVINTGTASFVYLQFREYYRDRPGVTRMDTGYVEVFNGTTWVKVLTHLDQSAGTGTNPLLTKLDISAHVNPALQVRFRYMSARAFSWAIDNVVVFTPPPADMGVVSIEGVTGNCGLPANFPVKIRVVNFGSETQRNFAVSYRGNESLPITEVFTDSVMPGDTASHTFAVPFLAPAPGSYVITSWTTSPGDPIPSNDTARSTSLPRLRANLAKVNFTGFTGANLNTVFPGWREATGLNPASGTSGWVNSAVLQTGWFGTETAKINLFQAAKKDWLISPPFNPVAGTVVRFKVAVTNDASPLIDSMGSDDSLIVKISTNCGQSWSKLTWYTKDDELTNQLLSQNLNLSGYAGQTVMLGFYATEGTVNDLNDYDVHLDDIEVLVPSPTDLGVTQITIPVSECGVPASLNLKVSVYNNGTQTQTSIPVSYTLNGQTPVSETFTGSIAPGATSEFTFVNPTAFTTPGQYTLSAWTTLAGDVNTVNDSTKNVRATRMPDLLPLTTFTGFTGTNLSTVYPGWKEQTGLNPTGTFSAWTSSSTAQTTALGSNTARVNLFGATQKEWLVSAPFNPGTGMFVKFKVAVTNTGSATADIMGSDDSVNVMVTTNCGQTWTRLHSFTVANALTNQLTGQLVSLAGYEGQTLRLGFFATEGSVNNTNDYDFHVDDIEVLVPSPTDLGVTGMTVPASTCGVPASWSLQVKVYNNGTQVQTSIPVSYSVNGQTPVSETFTGNLAVGGSSVFTFTNPVTTSTAGIHRIAAWTTLSGDVNTGNDSMKVQATRMADNFPLASFTGYNGTNLATAFPGWEEKAGLVPTGTVSDWLNSNTVQTTSLGSLTAKVNLFDLNNREWIISPPFNPISGAVLKFRVAVTDFNTAATETMGTDDTVHVMVTTDCGLTWSKIKSYTAASGLTNQLSDQSVALPNFAGQTIRVAFFATDGTVNNVNDYDFHLDDVTIFNSTETEEPASSTGRTVLYPNPAGNRIYIRKSSGNSRVSIYAMDGRCVLSGGAMAEATETGLDVSMLAEGIYRVKIETGDLTEVLPLMIRR